MKVEAVQLPRRWRWYHASVFRRLTVLSMTRDEEGRMVGRPKVALAYEPDAILETDSLDCARFFIEYDRGTEPIAGTRERRTIADKLVRIWRYFWVPRGHEDPGPHWSIRDNYYTRAFAEADLRAPRCLFITTSEKRRDNIRRLAKEYFADKLGKETLSMFVAVLTVEEARTGLRYFTAKAEAAEEPREKPWVAEVRRLVQDELGRKAIAEHAARARAAAEAEEARRAEAQRSAPAQGTRETRQEAEARARGSQQGGMMGRFRDLMSGKAG